MLRSSANSGHCAIRTRSRRAKTYGAFPMYGRNCLDPVQDFLHLLSTSRILSLTRHLQGQGEPAFGGATRNGGNAMSTPTLRVVAVLLFAADVLCAQQISGSIFGAVRDSQQSAIANAKVTLTNQEQGTSRDTVTGVDGSFVFTQLQPGN